ncbi:MAG: cation transporter [Candidatus Nezhaarchaeales archaeon]
MDNVKRVLIALVALSLIGGALKIYGGVIGESKSVLVDALTSIANSLAIIFVSIFFRAGLEPPDADHHYGHHRLMLGGPISMLMLYSFVAGVIVLDLVSTAGTDYSVGYEAPIFAAIAVIPYGLAILMARHYSLTVGYASFTTIELIESATSIISSTCGIVVSYVIDYLGAIALTCFLFVELAKNFREVMVSISDVASQSVVDRILDNARRYGLKVDKLRVRKILENVYQGDMIVRVSSDKSLEEIHAIIDTVERDLKLSGIDMSIHVEPLIRERRRGKVSSKQSWAIERPSTKA